MREAGAQNESAQIGTVLTFRFILAAIKKVKFTPPRFGQLFRVLEDIFGCKWTVAVLRCIASGVQRPGAITRDLSGISARVLNERLRKLQGYGVISRKLFNELPPQVECRLTPLGKRFAKALVELERIETELEKVD